MCTPVQHCYTGTRSLPREMKKQLWPGLRRQGTNLEVRGQGACRVGQHGPNQLDVRWQVARVFYGKICVCNVEGGSSESFPRSQIYSMLLPVLEHTIPLPRLHYAFWHLHRPMHLLLEGPTVPQVTTNSRTYMLYTFAVPDEETKIDKHSHRIMCSLLPGSAICIQEG